MRLREENYVERLKEIRQKYTPEGSSGYDHVYTNLNSRKPSQTHGQLDAHKTSYNQGNPERDSYFQMYMTPKTKQFDSQSKRREELPDRNYSIVKSKVESTYQKRIDFDQKYTPVCNQKIENNRDKYDLIQNYRNKVKTQMKRDQPPLNIQSRNSIPYSSKMVGLEGNKQRSTTLNEKNYRQNIDPPMQCRPISQHTQYLHRPNSYKQPQMQLSTTGRSGYNISNINKLQQRIRSVLGNKNY